MAWSRRYSPRGRVMPLYPLGSSGSLMTLPGTERKRFSTIATGNNHECAPPHRDLHPSGNNQAFCCKIVVCGQQPGPLKRGGGDGRASNSSFCMNTAFLLVRVD